MNGSNLTFRQLFLLPGKGVPTDTSTEKWSTFQESITKEINEIKWPAAMPDLLPKIAELFDVKIPDVFTSSWKKTKEIQSVLKDSQNSPEEVMYVELADHSIKSEHHPYVDIRIKGVTAKKIEFTVEVIFKLKAFELKIQNGAINEIRTGSCEAEGNIQWEGLTIAERKFEPIALPGAVILQERRAVEVAE